MFKNTVLFLFTLIFSLGNCSGQHKMEGNPTEKTINTSTSIEVGATQVERYLPLLMGKNVGILTNQSGEVVVDGARQHLVDFLLSQKIAVKKIFAPEHGFRGTADAGEVVKDGKDTKTGLPIISLYGSNKKPTVAQLSGIDMMVFDLQDVGARFYTYISSLHYVMEACAEQNIPLIVLDRPNPIGAKVDGPILEREHKSFVGMHPIPILHGLTMGEYAQMINGEKWLKKGVKCNLTVIPCAHYNKSMSYELPVKPSPNLPNYQAIRLYASLCFFEGTNVSAGRGTDHQFQIYGSPYLENMPYSFVPKPNEGAKSPKHNGKKCFGEDLTSYAKQPGIELQWLIKAYKNSSVKKKFFNNFFVKLAGTNELKKQIEQGWSEEKIKASWQKGIEDFKKIRKKYLIYSDF